MKSSRLYLNSAFTLVELMVSIVILTILVTAAFVSFSSQSSNARDSVRIADIANLTTWLNLYARNYWAFPNPEWVISSWTINGKEVAFVWDIWENISKLANISKTPKDPLTKWYYKYGISYNAKYFQIWVSLEEHEQSAFNNYFLDYSYADTSSNNYSTKVSGNYLWYIKFSTWSATYLANTPSLIFNFSGSSNIANNLLSWTLAYFVVDNNINFPYKLNDNMAINNKEWAAILRDVTNNQQATLTWVDITSIVNSTWTVVSIFNWTTLTTFWHSLEVVTNAIWSTNNNSSLNLYTTYSVASCTATWQTYTWSTTYFWCDTPDKIVCTWSWVWQIWSMCNVWASQAYNNQVPIQDCWYWASPTDCNASINYTLWGFFQWWRNNDVRWTITTTTLANTWTQADWVWHNLLILCDPYPSDWLMTFDDDLWWWSWTTASWWTYYTQWTPAKMKWPCITWYHVPTIYEWVTTVSALDPAITDYYNWNGGDSVATTLKLPFPGNRNYFDWEYNGEWDYTSYWSSTNIDDAMYYWLSAYRMHLDSWGDIYPIVASNRWRAHPVRCVKN